MSPCMTLDYFSFLSAFLTLITGRTVNICFEYISFAGNFDLSLMSIEVIPKSSKRYHKVILIS